MTLQTLCNSTKFTCDLVPWGTPNATYNKSECARTCKPQYICNVDYMGNGNGTCAVVPYGHPNATSNKTGCEAGCQKKYQCSVRRRLPTTSSSAHVSATLREAPISR